MTRGTSKHALVGTRVQIPAYSDLWMRGARYGAIARVSDQDGVTRIAVRMDHPQVKRLVWCIAEDCTIYPRESV